MITGEVPDYNIVLYRPPMLLLGRFLNAAKNTLAQQLTVAFTRLYHLVNHAPFGQTTHIAVVNEHVCLYLAAEMLVIARTTLLGKITVHGIELHSALPAPFHSVVEKFPLSHRP